MLDLSQWSKTKQKPLQIERRCCLLHETSTSSYCLKPCFTEWDPVVKWECSSHWFSSWSLTPFFPPFLPLLSLTFYAPVLFFCFFHQLLQNACLRATMSEAAIHHRVVFGERESERERERKRGKILLLALPCYVPWYAHPDPTHQTTPQQRPSVTGQPKQTSALIIPNPDVDVKKHPCVSMFILQLHALLVTLDGWFNPLTTNCTYLTFYFLKVLSTVV